jgi:putative phosphoribosyl transferase
MSDGTVCVDDRIVRDLDISKDYIEKEKQLQMLEIERRFALYIKKESQQPLESKINRNTIAILVDGGAASGATVIAAGVPL